MSTTYPVSIDNEYGALTTAIWPTLTTSATVYGMTPAPPAGRFHLCDRCGLDIEPDEPYYLSKDGTAAWCDSCQFEEVALL